MTTRTWALAVVFTLTGAVGCGKVKEAADRTKASNALKALSLDILNYQSAKGKPPASAAELKAYYSSGGQSAMQPGELEKLTVQWGVKIDSGASAGTKMLAWHPPVGKVVPVAFQDGSVKLLTESEFAAAPKAEPVAKP
jgi:hypothetical protein